MCHSEILHWVDHQSVSSNSQRFQGRAKTLRKKSSPHPNWHNKLVAPLYNYHQVQPFYPKQLPYRLEKGKRKGKLKGRNWYTGYPNGLDFLQKLTIVFEKRRLEDSLVHSLEQESNRKLSLHLICHRFDDKIFGNLRRIYLGERNIRRPHSAVVNGQRKTGVLHRRITRPVLVSSWKRTTHFYRIREGSAPNIPPSPHPIVHLRTDYVTYTYYTSY